MSEKKCYKKGCDQPVINQNKDLCVGHLTDDQVALRLEITRLEKLESAVKDAGIAHTPLYSRRSNNSCEEIYYKYLNNLDDQLVFLRECLEVLEG